ncbi:MAG: sensor histidine kinase [Acidobacteriota bacterium]
MQANATGEAVSLRDAQSYDYRKQQTAFCIVTLFALGILLLVHTVFASVIGEPSLAVLVLLALSFLLRLVELGWLQSRERVTRKIAQMDGVASILGNLFLVILLAWFSTTDHSPYQVLLAIPVLQAACLFGLLVTSATVVAAGGTIFFWMYHYSELYQQLSPIDYLEGGMLTLVLALTAVLIWFLVRVLRTHEAALSSALADLGATRLQLANEEKLSAIGRFASGIAHEIRNPLAMILSALATAIDPEVEPQERGEMFAIARHQASRLETLTTDFLQYARPADLKRAPILVDELLGSVESLTRLRVGERPIEIACSAPAEQVAIIDGSLVEAALLNLTLNAVDAVGGAGTVVLRADAGDSVLRIEVENSGEPIAAPHLERIFEPFYTTKPEGTGLGLAMAKATAQAHGGDLWVSQNRKGRVTFTMELRDWRDFKEMPDGQNTDR